MSWWRLPLAAAAVTLSLVILAFKFALPRLAPAQRAVEPAPVADKSSVTDLGRRALAEGNFYQAARELTAPGVLDGVSLTPIERRDFDQRQRQATLLSLLHGRALQELLLEAIPLRNPGEWKARFQAQHLGKAVVFDDVIGRDSSGRPSLTVYRVRAGSEQARVALDDLRLLWRLPMDPPRRMIFGGRLAGLVREDGGGWVFRFDPDSMVLLTDPGAVAACLGPPDADLLDVLRRQQQWVSDFDPGSGSH